MIFFCYIFLYEAPASQNNELKKVKQGREDVGVELYNVQQHLAKLQETLEKGHGQAAAKL